MEANRFRNSGLIFDTNALIYAIKNKVDLSNFKLVIPKTVLDELRDLEKSLSGEERGIIRIALKLVEKAEIFDSKKGDEGVLELAKKLGLGIITNDKELRKRAVKLGLAVGYVKFGKIVFQD
ncbi:MAG: PIN domain-containing protein [Archaeoglobaceae archaeon]|nr:PIN domain-containing protein [Archaeoglobaceae archaeon]